jgi:hypothetical protein
MEQHYKRAQMEGRSAMKFYYIWKKEEQRASIGLTT